MSKTVISRKVTSDATKQKYGMHLLILEMCKT